MSPVVQFSWSFLMSSNLNVMPVPSAAPMASAPVVYNDDGSVAWEARVLGALRSCRKPKPE
jgi:hypothetical protein